ALLVTSGGPGEGKSTTVVNLGISVAREGKHVVLVDADIRRPRLHTYFGLRNDHGLVEYLLDGAPLDEVLQPTAVEGLQIVTSGRPFHDPGQLIESEEIGQLIAALKRRGHMVILDSAPVLVKSDALVLARHTDDCLVVLESGKTTKKAVHEVLNLMARAGISPLGFVLNRVPIQKGTHVFQQYYAGHYGPEFSPGGGV
ncbi:MAG: CpsD/CapB family tyrosine-protein kinase, partial [Deltaproteobacteria bacterium]|nr:CpsD/CapB family tyrosine-protein kinase [Deltaproteobacteria bacterium]